MHADVCGVWGCGVDDDDVTAVAIKVSSTLGTLETFFNLQNGMPAKPLIVPSFKALLERAAKSSPFYLEPLHGVIWSSSARR